MHEITSLPLLDWSVGLFLAKSLGLGFLLFAAFCGVGFLLSIADPQDMDRKD
jgi:hypothetical protein